MASILLPGLQRFVITDIERTVLHHPGAVDALDDDARTRKIWRGLHRRYTTRLRTRVTTANLTWTIEAFAPPV